MISCVARVHDMDNLSCLIDWSLQLYREGKLYSSIVPYYFSNYCISYRDHTVSRLNVRVYSGTDGDISKAQANIVELTEAPNSDSEEPKSTDPIDTNTGKTRCIILLFLNYTIQYYLLVHLSYWSWMKT